MGGGGGRPVDRVQRGAERGVRVRGGRQDEERVARMARQDGIAHGVRRAGVRDQQAIEIAGDGDVVLGLGPRIAPDVGALARHPIRHHEQRLRAHRRRARQGQQRGRRALLGEGHVEQGRVLRGVAGEAIEGGAVEHREPSYIAEGAAAAAPAAGPGCAASPAVAEREAGEVRLEDRAGPASASTRRGTQPHGADRDPTIRRRGGSPPTPPTPPTGPPGSPCCRLALRRRALRRSRRCACTGSRGPCRTAPWAPATEPRGPPEARCPAAETGRPATESARLRRSRRGGGRSRRALRLPAGGVVPAPVAVLVLVGPQPCRRRRCRPRPAPRRPTRRPRWRPPTAPRTPSRRTRRDRGRQSAAQYP